MGQKDKWYIQLLSPSSSIALGLTPVAPRGNIIFHSLFIRYLLEKAIHSNVTSAGVTSHLITYSTWKDRLNNEALQGLMTQVDCHHGD